MRVGVICSSDTRGLAWGDTAHVPSMCVVPLAVLVWLHSVPCVLPQGWCAAGQMARGACPGAVLTPACHLCLPQRILKGKRKGKSSGRFPEAPGKAAAGRGSQGLPGLDHPGRRH